MSKGRYLMLIAVAVLILSSIILGVIFLHHDHYASEKLRTDVQPGDYITYSLDVQTNTRHEGDRDTTLEELFSSPGSTPCLYEKDWTMKNGTVYRVEVHQEGTETAYFVCNSLALVYLTDGYTTAQMEDTNIDLTQPRDSIQLEVGKYTLYTTDAQLSSNTCRIITKVDGNNYQWDVVGTIEGTMTYTVVSVNGDKVTVDTGTHDTEVSKDDYLSYISIAALKNDYKKDLIPNQITVIDTPYGTRDAFLQRVSTVYEGQKTSANVWFGTNGVLYKMEYLLENGTACRTLISSSLVTE